MMGSFKPPTITGLFFTPAPIIQPISSGLKKDRLRLANIKQILVQFDEDVSSNPNDDFIPIILADPSYHSDRNLIFFKKIEIFLNSRRF